MFKVFQHVKWPVPLQHKWICQVMLHSRLSINIEGLFTLFIAFLRKQIQKKVLIKQLKKN